MVDVTSDWWVALIIAGVAGLVGGFVYELVSPHGKAALAQGRVEKVGGGGLYDLGFVASMVVGAVTAIAFLYFLEPKEVVDGTTTALQYDGIKLVAASLLVGSGGSSVLKSLRERLLRVESEARNSAAEAIAQGAGGSQVSALGENPGAALGAISRVLNSGT